MTLFKRPYQAASEMKFQPESTNPNEGQLSHPALQEKEPPEPLEKNRESELVVNG
jgi:hypothetical protein